MDEEKAKEQVELLYAECSKGMFGDFKEDVATDIIAGNNVKQNMKGAKLSSPTAFEPREARRGRRRSLEVSSGASAVSS